MTAPNLLDAPNLKVTQDYWQPDGTPVLVIADEAGQVLIDPEALPALIAALVVADDIYKDAR